MTSKRVTREDRSWLPLALPTKTGEGFLIVEGFATRSGVFEYRNEDGSIRREWRPPDQVTDATALDSLRLKPVTMLHPEEPVTIENVAKHRVGQVGDGVMTEWPDETQSDALVRVRLIIDNADAIAAIEEKKMRELSCGYSADLDMTPGVTPQGEVYDAIQRNHRYNHLALVDVGRAGPNIGIRVDRADATNKENKQMKKLILDGVGFDAPEQTIDAVTAHIAKVEAKGATALAEANKAKDVAEARADAATAAEKAAKKAADDLAAKVAGMVKDRRALERVVAKVLPADAFDALNLDELDDDALRVAVIKHINADAVLDGKSSDYVRARFDVIVEQASAPRADSADKNDDAAKSAGTLRADTAPSGRNDAAAKARDAAIKRQETAWQKK